MPPTNVARRERLADAALEVLAREGSRGLTHRAVDAQAGEPTGTTSRYFRTRDALLRALVERARDLHFAELDRAPRGGIAPDALVDHLCDVVVGAVTGSRARNLAMVEMLIESTRHPELKALMTQLREAQIELMRAIHRAAGIELDRVLANRLVAVIGGLVVAAITTPEAVGMQLPDDIRGHVRALVTAIHAAPAAARPGGQA